MTIIDTIYAIAPPPNTAILLGHMEMRALRVALKMELNTDLLNPSSGTFSLGHLRVIPVEIITFLAGAILTADYKNEEVR